MGQFSALFNGLENTETKPKQKAMPVKSEKALQVVEKKPKATKSQGNKSTDTTEAPAPMRGKRSHPDYTQAPAFVRKATYKAVKIALLNSERGLDYSDLVEELLTTWLKNNR